MLTRRTFMAAAAAAGTTALINQRLLAQAQDAGTVMPTLGPVADRPLPTNAPRDGKYRPPYRLGLGGVPIGNGFAPTTDAAAEATLEAAWAAGVRYFDTSPWYGLGLSERRFGHFLHNHKPDEYVLSTKIGRLLTAAPEPAKTMWKNPSSFVYRYDYTADGTRRSIEDSLQRLGVSHIDIVFIHDVSPDNGDMDERWVEYYEQAVTGAMPTLTKMREEGTIKAWGFGINRPDALVRAIKDADPDIFLLATQYSLLEHGEALDKTLPALQERGISVVVGAPLNAGYLAGRDRYDYRGKVPADAPSKRDRISKIAAENGIDLRTAALQFAAAHPVVSAIIPGARTPEQVQANAKSMQVAIPDAFWAELKNEGLIAGNAPTPTVG